MDGDKDSSGGNRPVPVLDATSAAVPSAAPPRGDGRRGRIYNGISYNNFKHFVRATRKPGDIRPAREVLCQLSRTWRNLPLSDTPSFQSPVTPDCGSPDNTTRVFQTTTCIMAVQCKGGVVLGADSGTTGEMMRITDKIYCCRSGSAADNQAIADIVAHHLCIHQHETGEAPLVKYAAHLLQELCQGHDQIPSGIICAGWDGNEGAQIFCIPVASMCIRRRFAIIESGSTYIHEFVDANYKDDMTKDGCLELTNNALTLAIQRDGSSGGTVRLVTITKDGSEDQNVNPDHNANI